MSDLEFISLEGIDKTGKSLLHRILKTEFPEATFITDPTERAPWDKIFKNGPYLHEAITSPDASGRLEVEDAELIVEGSQDDALADIIESLDGSEVSISTDRVPGIVQSFLFLSARLHCFNQDVKSALESNNHVFADRFSDSWIAYQSIFREEEFEESTDPIDFFIDMHNQLEEAGFLATPDLTILITIEKQTLETRLRSEKNITEYEEHAEKLMRVQEQYRDIESRNPERIHAVKGDDRDITEVYSEVKEILEESGVVFE